MTGWGKIRNTNLNFDAEFDFLLQIDPAFKDWRLLAAEWWQRQATDLPLKRGALTSLFLEYIHDRCLDKHPAALFDRQAQLPDLELTLKSSAPRGTFARRKHDIICDFLDWVLREKLTKADPLNRRLEPINLRHPFARILPKKRVNKFDPAFKFLLQLDPEFDQWREMATEWRGQQIADISDKTVALTAFLVAYVHGQHLDKSPVALFDEQTHLPDLATVLELSALKETVAIRRHDYISDFLDWVLREKFAERSLDGYQVVPPQFRNPFPRICLKKLVINFDPEFRFLLQLDPAFEEWRVLAAEWWVELKDRFSKISRKGISRGSSIENNRSAFSAFFVTYLHGQKLEKTPIVLFQANRQLPDLAKVLNWSVYKEYTVKTYRSAISDFLDWVLREKFASIDPDGYRVVPPDLRNPFPRLQQKNDGRSSTIELRRVLEIDPRMEDWRSLAVEWLSLQRKGLENKRNALDSFLCLYAIEGQIDRNPLRFLLRTTPKPSFIEVFLFSKTKNASQAKSIQKSGTRLNNIVKDFIDWVLAKKLSVPDDKGHSLVPYEFHNPLPRLSERASILSETLKTPLPFRYIKMLRTMLAEGPTFCDWKWAQEALKSGSIGGDWFVADSKRVDRDDPDCVWRERDTTRYEKDKLNLPARVTELWSPVRAVAVYIKLELPLRTFQTLMLDSGEADTWRYEGGKFRLNDSSLAVGSEKRPSQRGVFHRSTNEAEAGFYINTNKTADIDKNEQDKGYIIPWANAPALYWLEKLRNWQERYNPISESIPWSSLGRRHFGTLPPHTDVLVERGNACFLFRDATAHGVDRYKPLPKAVLDRFWYLLLKRLEDRCFDNGEILHDGSPIRFVDSTKKAVTHFPLHALRVSLITHYVLDLGLPIAVVSKLIAGHARIIMTLYYTKAGKAYLNEVMAEAERKLLATQESSYQRFLMDQSYEEIGRRFAFISDDALNACRQQTSAAGFVIEDKGICPVGSALCDIGGDRLINRQTEQTGGPVPGYPHERNCVRCRFFLTGPAFLPGLQARFNQISYDAHECAERYNEMGEDIQLMENRRADCECSGMLFAETRDLERLSQRYEAEAEAMNRHLGDLRACHRLIARCIEIANDSDKDGVLLVAAGALSDIGYALTETPSEMHQIEVLCENTVIYPEIDARRPTIRRSQLLDCMMEMNGKPPVFYRLTPQQQLHTGNAVMKLIQARAGSLANAVEFVEGQRRLTDLGVLDETMDVIAEGVTAVAASQIIEAARRNRALATPIKPDHNDAS